MEAPPALDAFPGAMPPRVVVVPDVHGDLRKARQCLLAAGVVDGEGRWAARVQGTVVVQLGDQVDSRRRDSAPGGGGGGARPHACGAGLERDLGVLRFFDRLGEEARAAGGDVFSLLGNHELMNSLGYLSYADVCRDCEAERARLFRRGAPLACELARSRRAALRLGGRLLFCHAGVLPCHLPHLHLANAVSWRFLALPAPAEGEDGPLMDVESLLMGGDGMLAHRRYSPARAAASDGSEVETVLRATGTDALIIGHHAHDPGISSLQGGRLWVVDPGMSFAVMDGRAQVLVVEPAAPPGGGLMFQRIAFRYPPSAPA